MKNYLTIAQRWADVKREILVEHNRVKPVIAQIIEDHERVSGQNLPSEYIRTTCKLLLYPRYRGFVYPYSSSWHNDPVVDRNWEWTLKESEQVLIFLKSMHEEELKLLFREWTEKCCQ